MNTDQTQLAHTLVDLGYRELFQRLGNDDIQRIWNQPGAHEALSGLAVDTEAPPQARFLAAEILFYEDAQYPPDSAKALLASVYATALKGNFTLMANPWGLPESLGDVGQHVVALGDAAVPDLVPLLDDTTRTVYGGSRDATFGNRYEYRVKDLAAYLIAQIMGIPYTVKETPLERDSEIEKLKSQLTS